jgi:hypothetical protein
MATPTTTMVQCTACGTEFDSADAAQMQAHQGHPLVKIEQG